MCILWKKVFFKEKHKDITKKAILLIAYIKVFASFTEIKVASHFSVKIVLKDVLVSNSGVIFSYLTKLFQTLSSTCTAFVVLHMTSKLTVENQ